MKLVVQLIALVVLVQCSLAAAKTLRFSETAVLTHEPGYVMPDEPADVVAYAQQQHALNAKQSAASTQLPYCADCELFVQVAEWAVASNSTMTLIESLGDAWCAKHLNTSTTCPALIAKLVSLAERVPAFLKHLGVLEPVRMCSLLGLCSVSCCPDETTPQAIALSVGRNCSEMHVTWTTGGPATESVVTYGQSALVQSAQGYQLTYTDGGWIGVIHRVVLSGLECGASYLYSVGGQGAQSATYNFSTWNDQELALPFTLAVVGDMAAGESVYSTLNIAYLNNADNLNGVIHIGDISYADGYEATWDSFFSQLQPTMTRGVYQVVAGNHELVFNFSSYKTRFFGPGLSASPSVTSSSDVFATEPVDRSASEFVSTPSGTNLWSSWDAGCVHFVALMTEDNFNTAWVGDDQIAWLEQDLAATQARMARGQKLLAARGLEAPETCSIDVPTFIIVYQHRPLYCSDNDNDNCGSGVDATYLRGKLEDIFLKNGVDMVHYGHMHNYERTQNMYAGAVDAAGPMYFTNGAGGNREGVENNYVQPAPAWVAYRGVVAGVGELTVVNATSIEWNFYAQNNDTAHSVTLVDSVQISARNRANWGALESQDAEMVAEE